MNKKELFLLLAIPIMAIGISHYGVYQVDIAHRNSIANSESISQIDSLRKKIQSESPATTQMNLLEHIDSTSRLLEIENQSEQLYIDVMQAFFRDALIFSSFWALLLLAVFYTSNKRNAS